MGGGGVLGHMFSWCKLAGWVMNRLEWTACGYEYDEATHSIDTTRPLYRCSYCLKYRNISGWGNHENWCQLKLALKEYETKVKTLYAEWNYQINNKDQQTHGGMTTIDGIDDSPKGGGVVDVNNNKDKEMTLPSINTAQPVISTGFSVMPNNLTSIPFMPNSSNGTLWGFAYQQQQQLPHTINSMSNGLHGFNPNIHQQSPCVC